MIKSALLFSLKRITFHIFAEDPLAPQFTERVNSPQQIFTIAELLPFFLRASSLPDRR